PRPEYGRETDRPHEVETEGRECGPIRERSGESQLALNHFPLVEPSGCVCSENRPNLVAHPAENRELFLFVSFRMGWIIEGKMMPVHLPRKHRARLIGVAANG